MLIRGTAIILGLVACTSDEPATPTWHADIEPIVAQHCASCHSDAGIGGFSFNTYEDASLFASVIENAVVERRMPPWSATRECGDYRFDVSLSDAQIETVTAWAAAGAPEGDPADAVQGLQPLHSSLSRTDVSIPMKAAYTPDYALKDDQYRCFVLDWPEAEPVFITGVGVDPGNESTVHHVVMHVASPDKRAGFDALQAEDEAPGYACYGTVGGEFGTSSWLGGWVPGSSGMDFAPETGIAVQPGSAVIMQVHYHNDGTLDSSVLSTFNASIEKEVEHEAILQPMTDGEWVNEGTMKIPANTLGVEHTWSRQLPVRLNFQQSSLHMHTLGKRGSVVIEHADGSSECVVQIENYDFDWQRVYQLATPVRAEAGDTVRVTCEFDNETDQDVFWGDGTSDEMCLAVTYLTR